jgi:type II secretory pathway pseudopilin PulG
LTLIELLTVIAMMLVLVAAILPVVGIITKQQTAQADRISSLDDARIAVDRMTRDVRQACAISTANGTSSTLTLTRIVNATSGYLSTCSDYSPASSLHTIAWNCGVASATPGRYQCVRTDTPGAGGTPVAVVQVDQLSSNAPFTIVTGSSGAHPQVVIALQQLPDGVTHVVRLDDSATATLATTP